MSRKYRKNSLRHHSEELDTGPLNDILFILLMFFLFISTLANPNLIRMAVPRAMSDTKAKQTVNVSIDKAGKFYLGSDIVPILKDSLQSQLLKFIINSGDTTKPSIIINGDSSAVWGNIIYVMKAAKKLNATVSATVSGTE